MQAAGVAIFDTINLRAHTLAEAVERVRMQASQYFPVGFLDLTSCNLIGITFRAQPPAVGPPELRRLSDENVNNIGIAVYAVNDYEPVLAVASGSFGCEIALRTGSIIQ
jgi:hypothetical protein